jgi:hypothetical protein
MFPKIDEWMYEVKNFADDFSATFQNSLVTLCELYKYDKWRIKNCDKLL